jgi:hypothetical protein
MSSRANKLAPTVVPWPLPGGEGKPDVENIVEALQ